MAIEDVSDRLKTSSRGMELLLNALVAMEMLIKADNKYANTSFTREFLSKDSPKYLGHIIMLLGTDSGQAYSEQQIMDMLAGAGAHDIQRLAIQTPNDSGIITATV